MAEDQKPIKMTHSEWMVVQAVREYNFGKIIIHIRNGKAYRMEKLESELLTGAKRDMEVEIG